MTVAELIRELEQMPGDKELKISKIKLGEYPNAKLVFAYVFDEHFQTEKEHKEEIEENYQASLESDRD